jgi:hypothetical protein
MKYWFSDLGTLPEGKTIEINLSCAANVRVMDDQNFTEFKKNQQPLSFIGGYVKFAPYKVKVPSDGHWWVEVDLADRPGKVTAEINVYQTERKEKKKTVILPMPKPEPAEAEPAEAEK